MAIDGFRQPDVQPATVEPHATKVKTITNVPTTPSVDRTAFDFCVKITETKMKVATASSMIT